MPPISCQEIGRSCVGMHESFASSFLSIFFSHSRSETWGKIYLLDSSLSIHAFSYSPISSSNDPSPNDAENKHCPLLPRYPQSVRVKASNTLFVLWSREERNSLNQGLLELEHLRTVCLHMRTWKSVVD